MHAKSDAKQKYSDELHTYDTHTFTKLSSTGCSHVMKGDVFLKSVQSFLRVAILVQHCSFTTWHGDASVSWCSYQILRSSLIHDDPDMFCWFFTDLYTSLYTDASKEHVPYRDVFERKGHKISVVLLPKPTQYVWFRIWVPNFQTDTFHAASGHMTVVGIFTNEIFEQISCGTEKKEAATCHSHPPFWGSCGCHCLFPMWHLMDSKRISDKRCTNPIPPESAKLLQVFYRFLCFCSCYILSRGCKLLDRQNHKTYLDFAEAQHTDAHENKNQPICVLHIIILQAQD